MGANGAQDGNDFNTRKGNLMGTELNTTERKALAKLGRDATKEHRQCAVAGNAMLEHANLCGAYLLQAKETVPHGEWEDWLAEHFSEASPSAARGYMRISDRWAELEQNGNSVADLTVRGALKLLAKPREPALFEAPGPLPLGDEPAATSLVPSQDEPCPNCGATAFDEDGDCLECREPGVRPPEPSQDAPDEEEDEEEELPHHDYQGNVIPDYAVPVFADEELFDQAIGYLKALQGAITTLTKSPTGTHVEKKQIAAALREVGKRLASARPYCLCPYCGGKKCTACCETGIVTQQIFDASKEEES